VSILQVLQNEGFECAIFWNKDLNTEMSSKLHLEFKDKVRFEKNIFTDRSYSQLKKMQFLSQYDIFIYVTDGSYFFSPAKKNIIFALVPEKKLFNMSVINKVKTLNSRFITNSRFTQTNLQKWGVPSAVLYPYLDTEQLEFDPLSAKKEKIILSVGRFFKHLHAKRQDVAIEFFRKMKNEIQGLKDYTLVLAGGLKDEDKEYFDELQKMVTGDPSIHLKSNISYQELTDLYKRSEIYWHLAGYGVDENLNPQLTEHLGISPLEAMSYGCIDFCFNAGGLKETIEDGKTGYLFSSYEELSQKLKNFFSEKDHSSMQLEAKKYISQTFNYDSFKEKVVKLFI
jgi:glycosyltransferase involved in cell wall biosynthesis